MMLWFPVQLAKELASKSLEAPSPVQPSAPPTTPTGEGEQPPRDWPCYHCGDVCEQSDFCCRCQTFVCHRCALFAPTGFHRPEDHLAPKASAVAHPLHPGASDLRDFILGQETLIEPRFNPGLNFTAEVRGLFR